MSNIRVSYQELEAAAAKLEHGREEITLRLAELQQQIAGLTQSGFVTDRSSGAYAAAYEQFTVGAKNTISGLSSLSAFLSAAASTLADVDQQLAARLHF